MRATLSRDRLAVRKMGAYHWWYLLGGEVSLGRDPIALIGQRRTRQLAILGIYLSHNQSRVGRLLEESI